MTKQGSLALAALAIALSSLFVSADDDIKYFSTYKPAGLQSGPDQYGSTFASSATYSALDNSVILTGSTWGRFFESSKQIIDEDYDMYDRPVEHPIVVSGCFVAVAALPGASDEQKQYYDWGEDESNDQVYWSRKQRIRAPSQNEACNAVQLFAQTRSVVVAGHTEEKKNVTLNADIIVEQTVQYGLLLDQDWNVEGDKSFATVGGQLLKDSMEAYPIAMSADPSGKEEDGLFIVFMEAQLEAQHINIKEGQQGHKPQAYFNYGLGFGMRIARFDMLETHPTPTMTTKQFEETWGAPFDTFESKGDVYVTDLVHTGNLLVVVGSTNGQGEAYGTDHDLGSDMDGFVTKVSPESGQLIVGANFKSSVRIQSSRRHANDWITGVCGNFNLDNDFIYLVGTTEGEMPGAPIKAKGTSAFLIKLDVRSLEPVWTQQIDSQPAGFGRARVARGMACAVTMDDEFVWFGGVVEDDGVIRGADLKVSNGGQDIFVAGVNARTGEIAMVNQIGTPEDDELALRGGLVVDTAGNAVVVGNTYGSFYRKRAASETSADVFVLTISALTGEFPTPIGLQEEEISYGVFLYAIVAVVVAFIAFQACRHRDGWKNSSLVRCFRSDKLVGVGGLLDWRRIPALSRRRKAVETDRSAVTPYLNRYDIEDVDLKHSATGGWHCDFSNNLTSGKYVERESTSVISVIPETIMRNHLMSRDVGSEAYGFCDADSVGDMDASGRSTTGLLGGAENSPYGDLVDAYNSTFASRERVSNEGTPSWGKDII